MTAARVQQGSLHQYAKRAQSNTDEERIQNKKAKRESAEGEASDGGQGREVESIPEFLRGDKLPPVRVHGEARLVLSHLLRQGTPLAVREVWHAARNTLFPRKKQGFSAPATDEARVAALVSI